MATDRAYRCGRLDRGLAPNLTELGHGDPFSAIDTMAVPVKAGQLIGIAVDGEQSTIDEGIALLSYGYRDVT